ncbi:unnamed protein product [Ectocarpus sp. 4 AP-2014]
MWLVFRDEGTSLRHYLYTEREAEGFVLHGQSDFWRDMRLDPEGPEVMKSILRQTLEGTRFLHETGVVHRDLKPSNLIVSLPPVAAAAAATTTTTRHAPPPGPRTGSGDPTGDGRRTGGSFESADVGGDHEQGSSSSTSSSARRTRLLLRVADFSSAVDEGAMPAGLYGAEGPGQSEETLQYAPPEVIFDPETAYSAQRPESYDMWSIGVILLELILGTPEVFTVDQRTRAILDRDLAFEDDEVRAKAHLLAAMADMCIYSGSGSHDGEGSSSPLGDTAVVNERCTLADLGGAVHTRDALDIGFPDQWGLDLLWRLLRWDPMSRISASDALEHAYFVGPYLSRRDGTLHATQRDAMEYDGWFTGSRRISPRALAPRSPPSPYSAVWRAATPPGGDGFIDKRGGGLVPSAEPPRAATRGEANGSFTLDHQHTLNLKYSCPKCNRSFELWKSCHNHVIGRGHSSFCQYDTSSLPPCVSSHSMLPFDPHSGWCDVQGRRSRIEDYHSIVFQEDYKFYGVFDGHCGTRAAKFASRALHLNLEVFLNAQEATQPPQPPSPDDDAPPGNNASIERAVRRAFRKTQEDFLGLVQPGGGSGATPRPPPSEGARETETGVPAAAEGVAAAAAAVSEDDSGTTATVALVYPDVTVVAHVGDSRAVLCCDEAGRAVEITEDHTPYSASERARVEANGGSVEHRGVLRVNGELAVTRTLGNRRLSRHGVLSSEPDVVFVSHGNNDDGDAGGGSGGDGGRGGSGGSGGSGGGKDTAFLVLASDGLWDVVSSQEAVDMVKEVILGSSPSTFPPSHAPQGAAAVVDAAVGGGGARPGQDQQPRRRDGGRGVSRGYGSYVPGQTFQVAATALTHEAYVRGSTDNIGVCVVDLRHH